MAEMAARGPAFRQILVHTGQHYDYNMSRVFFEELGMPDPDEHLQIGSGSHAQQTAQIMVRFEPVLLEHRPDWVIVVGDVNSTVACALVCCKMGVRVAHVEAGLRSRDRTMPEEINRLLTDQIADLLLTPSSDADANLRREGIDPARIHLVGNVMIDTLVRMLPRVSGRSTLHQHGVSPGHYVLVTLHRPSNVDDPACLLEILKALLEISRTWPVVFPVHPRTRAKIGKLGITVEESQLRLVSPLGYLEFLALMQSARLVITDSGGVQEETTYLGVPCLTARPNTERPVTIEHGTNQLVASTYDDLLRAAHGPLQGRPHGAERPELWDGQTAARIADLLEDRSTGTRVESNGAAPI
jgi:UDP-N-acetylglucosamine 2-epimerase (non-hydrolysing)